MRILGLILILILLGTVSFSEDCVCPEPISVPDIPDQGIDFPEYLPDLRQFYDDALDTDPPHPFDYEGNDAG